MGWKRSKTDRDNQRYWYYERDLSCDCLVACVMTVLRWTEGVVLCGSEAREGVSKAMGVKSGDHDFDVSGPTGDQVLPYLRRKGSPRWEKVDFAQDKLNGLSPTNPAIFLIEGLSVTATHTGFLRTGIGHAVVAARITTDGKYCVCLDPSQGYGLVETPAPLLPRYYRGQWAKVWYILRLKPTS